MGNIGRVMSFQALVADFAQAMQIQYDSDTELLAIEAGEMQAFVRPHPLNPERIAVVIEAQPLGPDEAVSDLPAARLLLLHRLNSNAWAEHEWQIVIDEANMLNLRASRETVTVDAKALEEWLVDGLERAQALVDLWRNA